MADPRLFRLRVTYAETGRLAMLSHLEVARALERTVRRAGLPFAVTNGFSPHMRIAFGAALPVGVGGRAEFFDIFLTDYVAPAKSLLALQSASAPDLMPIACEYVEHNAPAASVACPMSTYEVQLDVSAEGLRMPPTIDVVKKKKQKMLVVSEYLVGDIDVHGDTFTFTLEAKPSGSLRPDVFVDECLKLSKSVSALPEEARVVRMERISQNS